MYFFIDRGKLSCLDFISESLKINEEINQKGFKVGGEIIIDFKEEIKEGCKEFFVDFKSFSENTNFTIIERKIKKGILEIKEEGKKIKIVPVNLGMLLRKSFELSGSFKFFRLVLEYFNFLIYSILEEEFPGKGSKMGGVGFSETSLDSFKGMKFEKDVLFDAQSFMHLNSNFFSRGKCKISEEDLRNDFVGDLLKLKDFHCHSIKFIITK